MKQRSFMPLTVFALSCVFLLLQLAIYDSSITGTSGWILIDMISFMSVFAPAFGLYVGAFHVGGHGNPKLQQYQLRWITEVVVIAGVFAVVSGIIFMGYGMSALSKGFRPEWIGDGFATSFIGVVYATMSVLSTYVISMFLLRSKAKGKTQTTPQLLDSAIPGKGINTRALIGLFVAGIIPSFGLFMQSANTEINFLLIIISYRVAILIGIFFIHMSLLHTPGRLLRVFALPIWRSIDWDANISESLQLIHDAVKLIGLYAILVTITAPVIILKNVGDATILTALLQPSIYVFWLIIILLYVYLIEGQLVQRHHAQTGHIPTEGRKGRSLLLGIGLLIYGFSIVLALFFTVIV